MAQGGVNPHTAADLLRQAMAQNNARHTSDEQMRENLLSGAPTPSGVETPTPDFQDKRMPGIMPSYFGQQVGNQASSKPQSTDAPVVTPPSVGPGTASYPSKHVRAESQPSRRPSTSSVGSLVEVARDQVDDTPPTSGDMSYSPPERSEKQPGSDQPPTPISSDPYEVQGHGRAAENGGPLAEGGLASITQVLRNFVRPKPKSTFSSQARRHQSLPTASVTRNSVAAAHFSNPTSSSQSPQNTTPPSPPLPENPDSSISVKELNKLTLDAAPESREKNTPPLTPRALSHNEHVGAPRSPRSNVSATPSDDGASGQTASSARKSESLSASTGTPRGKLAVKIAEGRGLRPAVDPYCVCVFEWNEYISKGPRHDRMDVDNEKKHAPPNLSSVPIRRTDSDMGKPMAVPMRSRQSSTNGLDENRTMDKVTDPQWDHEATFDVVGEQSEIDISVYDRRPGSSEDVFLGHVRTRVQTNEQHPTLGQWMTLRPRAPEESNITGEIFVNMQFSKVDKRTYGPNDFQILKLVGKGTFGQVYQVRKKDTGRIYAMKVLSKKVIIQKKEIAHTLGERNILVRTAMTDSPFIVGLKFSFQTPTDLYLVTDFMSGGELFWHLQKEGRFKEDRAKFYIAELILALKHLHQHDIVYRDLKPENILLDANGHIALCDFGLSKANLTKNDTTNTFCGTTEYLAPEVLLDEQGYTKMVDFWSLGVLVFEMCCGWSPFYAEDTQQMYKNIAFGKVRFPRDALSTEGRNFVKGLLNRNPKHRLGANRDADELVEHPFFADVDWQALGKKNLVPPFKPKLTSMADTSHFDPEFTNALNTSSSLNARAQALAQGAVPGSTPLSPTMQNAFKGFTFVDDSALEQQYAGRDDINEDNTLSRTRTNQSTAGNRMSGIQRTGTQDETMFGENWDM
ncbi:Serine/threonine-protein kinase [Knufia obscura]|uniref:Serine/threonine-protein kinase n=1 Tax=Knufia obscura TaxID=1635080 RepID=A0ABR0RI66_9EURO|nr:Serine/threonine-protein kinase [Knufia obscura]